jgi:hypothetical protein
MGDRRVGSLAVLVVIFTVGSLGTAPLVGQTRPVTAQANESTSAKPWSPPLTPDGHPDFQGVWVNNSATPLERPKALEGRQFLTDDEVAMLKRRADRFRDNDSDFAGGDSLYLAALSGVEKYKSPVATGAADVGADREFESRTSLIVDPPDGLVPFTPEGQRRQAEALEARARPAPKGPEDLPNDLRCLTFGVPRLGGGAASYNSYYQIVQTPGYIVLFGEVIHDARVIPLDGRPHAPADVRLLQGDSRGRWEGRTLVIDTTNFSAKSFFEGSSDNLHLVERFTRTAQDAIDYEITVSDTSTWTRPWTAVVHLKQSPDRMFEYACHEGNDRTMTDMLLGARAAERSTSEAPANPKSSGTPHP